MSAHDHSSPTNQPSWRMHGTTTDPSGDAVLPDTRSPEDLHICPECTSTMVYPTDWVPVDLAHWRVDLRCPECEWRQAGLYEQGVLDRFDTILDAGTDSLVHDLGRLQRANMEHEVERFSLALEQNLIVPEDF